MPWGAAWMLAGLLVVEVLIRCIDPSWLNTSLGGGLTAEYRSAATHLETEEVCEVCFLGDSRVQEGVLVDPVLAALAREGRPAPVLTNYGLAAAGTPELLELVQALLQRGETHTIFLGLSPHTFALVEPQGVHRFALWPPGDLLPRAWAGDDEALAASSEVVEHRVGQVWHTFRYRNRLLVLAEDLYTLLVRRDLRAWPDLAYPGRARGTTRTFYGEAPPRQTRQPDRSLARDPMTAAEIRADLERVTGAIGGEFQWDRWAELQALTRRCVEAGVRLVLFEVPLSEPLREALPDPVETTFARVMREHRWPEGVAWVPYERLGLSLTDEHFLEYSHLNAKGARLWTDALLETVVLPEVTR